jgi:hypothetical protein
MQCYTYFLHCKNMLIFVHSNGLIVSTQPYIFNTEEDRDILDSNNYIVFVKMKGDPRSSSPSVLTAVLKHYADSYYDLRPVKNFSSSLHAQPAVSIADSSFIMLNCRPFAPFMSSPFRWPTVNTLTVRSAYSRLFALDCLVGTLTVLLRKVLLLLLFYRIDR